MLIGTRIHSSTSTMKLWLTASVGLTLAILLSESASASLPVKDEGSPRTRPRSPTGTALRSKSAGSVRRPASIATASSSSPPTRAKVVKKAASFPGAERPRATDIIEPVGAPYVVIDRKAPYDAVTEVNEYWKKLVAAAAKNATASTKKPSDLESKINALPTDLATPEARATAKNGMQSLWNSFNADTFAKLPYRVLATFLDRMAQYNMYRETLYQMPKDKYTEFLKIVFKNPKEGNKRMNSYYQKMFGFFKNGLNYYKCQLPRPLSDWMMSTFRFRALKDLHEILRDNFPFTWTESNLSIMFLIDMKKEGLSWDVRDMGEDAYATADKVRQMISNEIRTFKSMIPVETAGPLNMCVFSIHHMCDRMKDIDRDWIISREDMQELIASQNLFEARNMKGAYESLNNGLQAVIYKGSSQLSEVEFDGFMYSRMNRMAESHEWHTFLWYAERLAMAYGDFMKKNPNFEFESRTLELKDTIHKTFVDLAPKDNSKESRKKIAEYKKLFVFSDLGLALNMQ